MGRPAESQPQRRDVQRAGRGQLLGGGQLCRGRHGFLPVGRAAPTPKALAERLSGGVWTIASTPVVSGATSTTLNDVSCPVAGFCVAIGTASFAAPHPSPESLAETWNGKSWTAQILPAPPGGSGPGLAAVSCPAKGSCVAVGGYISNKSDTTDLLAERLTGSSWSVLRTPVPPHGRSSNANSEFTDVDCPSAAQCDVVGIVGYNDTLQAVFAYALSGSTWTYQRQVNPGPDPGNLEDAVSCSSTSACTSAGAVEVIGEQALAEYWNGTTWVRQATPTPNGRPETMLDDVSCDGGSSCVTVGESWRVDPKNGHLIDPRVMGEVWNGKTWSQSPPVIPAGASVSLGAISCPAPTACIAVGSITKGPAVSTLVESYTG